MSQSSPTTAGRARKTHLVMLRALQEPGRAVAIATALGISESSISRFKNDHLEQFASILTHSGLKVVPADYQCVDPKTFAAFEVLYERAMSLTTPSRLIFEETQQGGL